MQEVTWPATGLHPLNRFAQCGNMSKNSSNFVPAIFHIARKPLVQLRQISGQFSLLINRCDLRSTRFLHPVQREYEVR